MPAFKKNNPGCCACATCSNLPDTLYLADDPKSRPSGSTTPAKVPFIYDAGAGLWVCAVTVYNVNIGGTAALGTCTGSGAFTTYVYQMNASFLLTVQSEACKLNSSTLAPLTQPENSAPAGLTGSLLYGPLATTSARGTYKSTLQLSCSDSPSLLIFFGSAIQITDTL
jgi:hypothetical protein